MSTDLLVLTVSALYISPKQGAASVQVPEFRVHPDSGIIGDSHRGRTRIRSTGEVVQNLRQFTAVNAAELGRVADALGIPYLDPLWIKANICFSCPALEHFTSELPPKTQLVDATGRAVLEIKGVTDPCTVAGSYVAAHAPHLAAVGRKFPKAAIGQRGVYGVALEEATIQVGDSFTLVFPRGGLTP